MFNYPEASKVDNAAAAGKVVGVACALAASIVLLAIIMIDGRSYGRCIFFSLLRPRSRDEGPYFYAYLSSDTQSRRILYGATIVTWAVLFLMALIVTAPGGIWSVLTIYLGIATIVLTVHAWCYAGGRGILIVAILAMWWIVVLATSTTIWADDNGGSMLHLPAGRPCPPL